MSNTKTTVAVIGLGYVGLPLAVEFGKRMRTIGFDISEAKINCYKKYFDPTGEVESDSLRAAIDVGGLQLTTNPSDLSDADFLIIAVPTPVTTAHIPDFSPLITASITAGQYMKAGATIIYESTVYPGATEDVCIPILERESQLKWRRDFHVEYSPERVNPGDKDHTITKIVKIVSGDDDDTLNSVGNLYESVITAGVHRVSSIKVAEAAKVIENTQRDLNIALMNELAIIFDKIGIDTQEVLKAAGTKWNFLPFRPGLVGGHCIGVDPYYLTYKADTLGYHSQVILAGRRINDEIPAYIAQQTIKRIIETGGPVKGSKVLMLGVTFKENCSDIRNSKSFALIDELNTYGCHVLVHDPIANGEDVLREYQRELTPWEQVNCVDVIILAVAHHEYLQMGAERIVEKLVPQGVFIDVKSAFPKDDLQAKGVCTWRL